MSIKSLSKSALRKYKMSSSNSSSSVSVSILKQKIIMMRCPAYHNGMGFLILFLIIPFTGLQATVCGQYSGDCNQCIARDCYYIQFLSNNWGCVDSLAGWSEVVRVIAPLFPDLCGHVESTTARIIGELSVGTEVNSSGSWLSVDIGDVILFILMVVGFWILFSRDRRIVQAIENIPDQIRNLTTRHNNYYLQLERNYENNERLEGSNPFLPIAPGPSHQRIQLPPTPVNDMNGTINQTSTANPIQLSQVPIPLPFRSSEYEEIEMEHFDNNHVHEDTTPDSSPEVLARVNYFTRSGRLSKLTNFFKL